MGSDARPLRKLIILIVIQTFLIQVSTRAGKDKGNDKDKAKAKAKVDKCYGNWEKKIDKEICKNLVPSKFGKPQRIKSPFTMKGGQDKDYTYHTIGGDDKHVISDVYIAIHPPNPKVRFPFERTGFKNEFNCYCCADDTKFQGRILKLKRPKNVKDNRVSFQVEHNIQNFTVRAAVFQDSKIYWIIDHVPINRSFDKKWIVHP